MWFDKYTNKKLTEDVNGQNSLTQTDFIRPGEYCAYVVTFQFDKKFCELKTIMGVRGRVPVVVFRKNGIYSVEHNGNSVDVIQDSFTEVPFPK